MYNGTPLNDLQFTFHRTGTGDALTPVYPTEQDAKWGVDAIRVYGTKAPVSADVFPIGLAVDLEEGTKIYVTYKKVGLDESGTNWLAVYDEDLTLLTNINLSGGGYLWSFFAPVYPRCVWQPTVADFGFIVYLFGPAEGIVGTAKVFKFVMNDPVDDLPTVTICPPTTDIVPVSALATKGDGAGGLLKHCAFLGDNRVYNAADDFIWSYVGDAPFVPHRRGISIAYDVNLTSLLTNAGAAAAMAETALFPYIAWTNITDALPIDGGIVYAEWITP